MSRSKSPTKQPRRGGLEKTSPKQTIVPARGSGKLSGKVALITGADSGIGRAIALLFAREGADISFIYLDEHDDAAETVRMVTAEGRRCIKQAGDIGNEDFCRRWVDQTAKQLGRLDILINNAGEQTPKATLEEITEQQLVRTFRTNIFGMFFMTKAALRHMKEGAAIVNTTSITAYRGSANMVDYSASKGAIVTFTRSLSQQLAPRNIRVNAVAPGPIWTPLITSTFPNEKAETFGSGTPMKRGGRPEEVAPSFLFLVCEDSSYMTGQVLHPNGGIIVNN